VLGVLAVIITPVFFISRFLFYNAESIASFISNAFSQASTLLISNGINYTLPSLSSDLILGLTSFVFKIPTLIFSILMTLALIFYFLRDGPKIKEFLMQISADEHQKQVLLQLESLLNAVIFGYIASAIIIGLIAWIGFVALGYNYALILSIGVGIAALIPIIGTWAIYIPLTAYELYSQNYYLSAALIILTIITILLEIFLRPKLASKKANVSEALMLVGFVGGIMFFGFKGILIGPITLGALKIILESYRKR